MKKTSKAAAKTVKQDLPNGVIASDLKKPKWDGVDRLRYSDDYIPEAEKAEAAKYPSIRSLGLDRAQLCFYLTEGFGWVLTTLHISNPSRRQAAGTAARTYGITVEGKKLVTVGRGPHVKQELTVYLKKSNIARLMPLVELYLEGLSQAGQTRDRISSRRAQGQMYRQQGRSSWMW